MFRLEIEYADAEELRAFATALNTIAAGIEAPGAETPFSSSKESAGDYECAHQFKAVEERSEDRISGGTTVGPFSTSLFNGDDDSSDDDKVGADVTGILANGLPWDARIHSEGRKTLAKAPHGWKYRRCPKEHTPESWQEYINTVEAELTKSVAANPPAATLAPTDVVVQTPVETVSPPAQQQAYVLPGSAGTPLPTVENLTAQAQSNYPYPADFGQFMGAMTNALTSGGASFESITAAAVQAGLTDVNGLSGRPDLIPQVCDILRGQGVRI
jgi:hypothetical protein